MNKQILSSLVLAFFVAACSAKKGVSNSSSEGHPLPSMFEEEQRRTAVEDESKIPPAAQAQYYFLRGQVAMSEEKYDQALEFLKKASELDTSSAPTLRKSLAQLYLRLGKSEEASEEVEKALKNTPDDLELLQLKGGIYATRHDSTKAIETYNQIIKLKPQAEDAYVFIASLYAQDRDFNAAKEILQTLIKQNPQSFFGYYYFARMSEAAGDVKSAEAAYKKALLINPKADSVSLDLARVYGAQKKYKAAIEICEQILKDDSRNLAARNLLGQLLLGDNRVDKALKEFEKVGALENDPTDTRLKIALIKIQQSDLNGAVVELILILTEKPDYAAARYYLASCYSNLKRVTDALSEIDKIKPTDEYYADAKILASFLLSQDKRYDEAIANINQLLESKHDDNKLLMLLANLQHDAQDIQGAVDTTKHLVELNPTDDKHFFNLGVLLDEQGKKDEALAAMNKAIELNPKNANALNYLGYSLVEKKEKLDEAEKLIRQALKIEKNNGYFIDSLGWLYYIKGNYPEALKELESAVKFVPNDSVILEHQALILIKLNRNQQALEVVNKALSSAPQSDDKQVEERLKKLLEKLQAK